MLLHCLNLPLSGPDCTGAFKGQDWHIPGGSLTTLQPTPFPIGPLAPGHGYMEENAHVVENEMVRRTFAAKKEEDTMVVTG